MEWRFLEREVDYTGAQLRRGWAGLQSGVGDRPEDVIVAFVGACDVAAEHMADLEDLRAGARIVARRMLHFIAEHFHRELPRAVWQQRTLAAIAAERLNARLGEQRVRREGDDLFVGDRTCPPKPCRRRKLTVSIAARSPRSALIHLGVNIDPAGAPVPAVGLEELGVEPEGLAREVMEAYAAEVAAAEYAVKKVRGVP